MTVTTNIRINSSSVNGRLIPMDLTSERTRRRQQHREGDARTTKLDDLDLKSGRAFGYWFDFGDDWYHQVQVDRIEQAIPTVTYPRVIRRVGKSPPQYCDE